MTLEEAETLALKIVKQVMEEKINNTNVEMAAITKEKGFHIYPFEKLQKVIERLPK